jgi:L-lactate utilization protein LutB
MDKPVENFWHLRMRDLKETLEANNFEVYLAGSTDEARTIVLQEILPKTGARRISWGGSITFTNSGLYDAFRQMPGMEVLDTFDKSVSPEQALERRRQALLSDLFITGTNAITENGQLVNLDMIGNRVAAITFGPKNVLILCGRNKIVADIEHAMLHIKEFTAPTNAMRLDKKTPCANTSYCEECKSPDRICNHWTITEKSFPQGRIKIVLINEVLGI